MGISAVGRQESVGRSASAGGPRAVALALSLGGDRLALKHRDGGPERAPIIPTPGLNKLAVGGSIFGLCAIGLGLTISAVTAPFWVPLAFGAGALVGGAIALRGAKEFADHLAARIGSGLPK